ncbi:ARABIDILLO-1 [Striga asiatica]|uniref:ARABIDILLO-1 n=1 Tax=Striga asiatica TaxID=4170 RepID=A0A5A7RJ86_STRAF|nr:ARABIDILLO-1 [Striga asiatica]
MKNTRLEGRLDSTSAITIHTTTSTLAAQNSSRRKTVHAAPHDSLFTFPTTTSGSRSPSLLFFLLLRRRLSPTSSSVLRPAAAAAAAALSLTLAKHFTAFSGIVPSSSLVHLPARNAVDHPAARPGAASAGGRPYELGVGLRPLVEAGVIDADWVARVAHAT